MQCCVHHRWTKQQVSKVTICVKHNIQAQEYWHLHVHVAGYSGQSMFSSYILVLINLWPAPIFPWLQFFSYPQLFTGSPLPTLNKFERISGKSYEVYENRDFTCNSKSILQVEFREYQALWEWSRCIGYYTQKEYTLWNQSSAIFTV